jgi:hypothetical protein
MTLKEKVLRSPCTHTWLKEAVRALDDHDCVDMLYDAKTLVLVAEECVVGNRPAEYSDELTAALNVESACVAYRQA